MGERILPRAAAAGGAKPGQRWRAATSRRRADDVRHRGLRGGAAREGAAARRSAGGRCDLRFRRAGRFGAGIGDGPRKGVAAACASGAAARAGQVARTGCGLGGDGPERRAFAGSAPAVPASRLSAEIAMPPVYRGATEEQALQRRGGLRTAVHRSSAGARAARIRAGVTLTRIGTMRKGTAGAVLLDGEPLAPLGYDHFRIPMSLPDAATWCWT